MSDVQRLCTFFVDGHAFGLDVHKVQEITRAQPMTRVPLAPPAVRGLINLRGQIVTAIDLRRCLGIGDRPADQPAATVIVRSGDGAVSLLVDDIGDVLEVAETTFERPPPTLTGPARELIHGAYKLPDRLLLLLDADKVLNLSAPERSARGDWTP